MPDGLVNQIAAGEVIERPAAAVKELVENALDAGATRIAVSLHAGGLDRIEVVDNGAGMTADQLVLAVQRHCTSKLGSPAADGFDAAPLVHIATLGFRGEALPSIGAAARLSLTSRPAHAAHGHVIRVEGGHTTPPLPAAAACGTVAVVADLFYATPARRKFLKSPRTEGEQAELAVRRLAFAWPDVAFRCELDGRVAFDLPAQSLPARVAALLGGDALLPIDATRETPWGVLRLHGLAGAPHWHRATQAGQSLVVNGRPVTDPVLRTAVRVAYRDVLMAGRHPVLALYLVVPRPSVDVNVHPAKTELRFQDPAAIRALVIGGLGRALGGGASADVGDAGANGVRLTPYGRRPGFGWARPPAPPSDAITPGLVPPGFGEAALPFAAPPSARYAGPAVPRSEHPLGAAVAQVLDTYVLAVTAAGSLVIVDQHAAHERLVQERLQAQLQAGAVASQALLLPAVVDLAPAAQRRLLDAAGLLRRLGLEIEAFGPGAVLVRALPAALGAPEPGPLLHDLADELSADSDQGGDQWGEMGCTTPVALQARLDAIVVRLACHGSIRAGRRLQPAEMDALLRQMETTPRASTCSHGRPTVLTLTRAEIEALFGRR